MATAREIRRRIRSVKNVAQITRALQLVASSKLRRTQARVLAARPYATELQRVLIHLSHASADDDTPSPYFYSDREDADLSLLQERPIKRFGIVLISPDGSLSGALPGNLNRKALAFAQQQKAAHGLTDADIRFVAVGKRGRDFLLRNRLNVIAEFTGLGDTPKSSDVRAIARVVSDAYLSGEVDAWYLIYPRFISSLTQTPSDIQLLPVQPPEAEAEEEPHNIDYIFEPDAGSIYAALLPRYLETLIYQPLLELVASFYAAQFLAMKNATDNANDLVADLNLTYNKARQAAITNQILEVVAGAGDQ